MGANVFGTATDDAHHYFDAAAAGARGEPVFPGGLGFVMVRAAKQPGAIRDALARGDFYASTGVLLARVARAGGPVEKLEIAVDARSPGPHSFTFIGAGGRVLARSQGRSASFRLGDARGGYVRVVVEDPAAAAPGCNQFAFRGDCRACRRRATGLTRHVSVTSNTALWQSFTACVGGGGMAFSCARGG